jgi:hypothetical protein
MSVFTTEFSALNASIPWALTHGKREDRPRVWGNAEELAKFGLKPEYDAQQAVGIMEACADYLKLKEAGKLGQWSRMVLKRPQAHADKADAESQAVDESRRRAHLANIAVLARQCIA